MKKFKKILCMILAFAITCSISIQGFYIADAADNVVHNSRFDGYIIEKGIDVSKYQGTINWSKVKSAGYTFAIIRVGYRGYGTPGTMNADSMAVKNIDGALQAGIEVGVYFYSQAISTAEAKEEADYVLDFLKTNNYTNADITLPIVIDYEFASVGTGRLYKYYASLSSSSWKSNSASIVMKFCSTVEAAGYQGMVYANKSMLESMNAAKISASYPIWLAHYTTQTSYAGDYSYWQYTSKGSVSGISGNVDLNFRYVEPGFDVDGLYYSIVDEDARTVEVVGAANKTKKEYEVPSKITYNDISFTVVGIADSAFKGYTKLESIKIASTVTYIGNKAFYGCTNLSGVTDCIGLTKIGASAFYKCTSLSYINNAAEVKTIGSKAFAYCSKLQRVGTELGVTALTKLTSVGSYAFYDCSKLTDVKIPSGVTKISDKTFVRCTSLESVEGCANIKSIGSCAFYKCTALTHVNNLDNVTKIASKAFAYCSSLVRVGSETGVIALTKLTSVGSYAFYDCSKLSKVKLPSGVTAINSKTFVRCTSLSSVEGCVNVESIGSCAFYKCSSLTNVNNALKLTEIDSKAFAYCSKLKRIGNTTSTITLEKVKNIENYAFYDCSSILKVKITSADLTAIGQAAFRGCTSMTSFSESSTKLHSIGKQAFYNDKKLASVSFSTSGLTSSNIGTMAFTGISSSCAFYVPSGMGSTYASIFKAKGAPSKITTHKI